MKTKFWVLIIAAIFTVSLVLAVVFATIPKNDTVQIFSDGKLLYTINLSEVDKPYSIIIEYENGYNEILVERGRIMVKDADCGDKTCVNCGWYEGGVSPIVCLPHKLIIKSVKTSDDFDLVVE